jgi:hypothetical protein
MMAPFRGKTSIAAACLGARPSGRLPNFSGCASRRFRAILPSSSSIAPFIGKASSSAACLGARPSGRLPNFSSCASRNLAHPAVQLQARVFSRQDQAALLLVLLHGPRAASRTLRAAHRAASPQILLPRSRTAPFRGKTSSGAARLAARPSGRLPNFASCALRKPRATLLPSSKGARLFVENPQSGCSIYHATLWPLSELRELCCALAPRAAAA